MVLLSVSCATSGENTVNDVGGISGRISPKDASVGIIAKTGDTEYKVKGNI